jgi:hypothetical protein
MVTRTKLALATEWWPLVREIVTCGLGAFILAWQTSFEDTAQAYLVAAGCALVGVPFVGLLQRQARNGNSVATEDEKP